jgi:hypothetical protein
MPTQSTPRRPPALIAEFASAEEARAAMEALENRGIDGLEISLLDAPAKARRDPADQRLVHYLGGRVVTGVALGAVIGATVFGVAAVVFGALGWPLGAVVATVLTGIALGAILGAFFSFERGVGLSDSWENTFLDELPKPIRVGVHAVTDSDTARAREALEHHRPLAIRTPQGSGTTP